MAYLPVPVSTAEPRLIAARTSLKRNYTLATARAIVDERDLRGDQLRHQRIDFALRRYGRSMSRDRNLH
jgi:hypothetical protein